MSLSLEVWALHDSIFEMARERGLRAFRVECKVTPAGETVIALVLASDSGGRTARAKRLS